LLGLARAFAAIAATDVGDAMCAHPHLVGGNGRDVTRLMQAAPGLAAKDGAEGVFVAASRDAGCVAVKIDDGAARARTPVVVRALELLGVSNAELSEVAAVPVLGHGEVVGHVRAVPAIG
jgi:L-asparaginase II